MIGAALAVGAASNLSTNLINTPFQRAAAKQQFQYQLALQNNQNAWQEKMWNAQNEYNTPANQAERLRQGGYNPALVASNGQLSGLAGSAGSAGSSSYSMPNMQYGDVSQGMNALSNSTVADASADNQNADAAYKWASLGDRLQQQRYQTDYSSKLREFVESKITSNNAYSSMLFQQRAKDYMQTEWTAVQLPYAPQHIQSQISSNLASAYSQIASGQKSLKEIDQIEANLGLIAAKVMTEYAQQDYYHAGARAFDSQVSLNGHLGSMYDDLGALYREDKFDKQTTRWHGGFDFHNIMDYKKQVDQENYRFYRSTDLHYKMIDPTTWLDHVEKIGHIASEYLPWKFSSSTSFGSTTTNYDAFGDEIGSSHTSNHSFHSSSRSLK